MIQILITGGTFDKSYNHISGDLFFEKTHIPEMLERSKCRLNVDVKTLMMIDSLEMTQKDIEKIIEECKKTKSSRIVITHGTDTMVNTAEKIAEKIKNKTIILTGAMIPYAFGSSSDGFFNLGSALSFVQTLKNGVYIAINGQYFDYDKVEKNKLKGYFEKK
jgi:L-asparaginase